MSKKPKVRKLELQDFSELVRAGDKLCANCRFWKKTVEGFGKCKSMEVFKQVPRAGNEGLSVLADFGCRHFEARNPGAI